MILRKEFYYLRHGQTEHNVKNILTVVDENPPLTIIGIQQAHAVKEYICKLPIQTVCHSPLERVKQTMQIATHGVSARYTEIHDLKECNGPIWESMTSGTHNEEVLAFYQQTISGFNQALAHPGPVLIVAHGGVHWALCSQLQIRDHLWAIDNCQLAHFRPHKETEWIATIIN